MDIWVWSYILIWAEGKDLEVTSVKIVAEALGLVRLLKRSAYLENTFRKHQFSRPSEEEKTLKDTKKVWPERQKENIIVSIILGIPIIF